MSFQVGKRSFGLTKSPQNTSPPSPDSPNTQQTTLMKWIRSLISEPSRCSMDDDVFLDRKVSEALEKRGLTIKSLYRSNSNVESKSCCKIVDEEILFETKIKSFLSDFDQFKRIIVFYEETNPNLSTTLCRKQKLTKYQDWFEPYIMVKPSKKKSEARVKIDLIEKIKNKEKKISFQKTALFELLRKGAVNSIVTTSQDDDFHKKDSQVIQLYGTTNGKRCSKCNFETNHQDVNICGTCNEKLHANAVQEGQEIDKKKVLDVQKKIEESDLILVFDTKFLDEYVFVFVSISRSFLDLPMKSNKKIIVVSPTQIPHKYHYLISSNICAGSEDVMIRLMEHLRITL